MGLYDPQYWIKSSFDIAARKDVLLMIKIVLNIDKVTAELVEDLKLISYFFKGIPIIVGKDSRKDELRDDVVYERRGIPAVTINTFKKIIKYKEIYIISKKGGYYTKVDGERLHQARIKHDLSLQDVSKKLKVSRKAVYLFERMNQIKEENAQQLEDLFNESLSIPVDVLNWEIEQEKFQISVEETDFQAEIKELIEDLGCDIYWAKKAPFDAITSEPEETKLNPEESCLITSLSPSQPLSIYNRLQLISEISKVARKLSMFIIDEGNLPPADNVLILQRAFLEKMRDIKELYLLLKKVKRSFY